MVELNDNGIIKWSDDDLRERRIQIGDITSIDLKNPAPVTNVIIIVLCSNVVVHAKISPLTVNIIIM